MGLSVISSRISTSTWWWSAILNVEWRAFQRSLILRHWQLLYLMDSIAGNLYLLTQFISSQDPCFLLAISWILSSKKIHFVDLTVLLNAFQFSKFLVVLYLFRTQLQLLFHQLLECFVIWTCLVFIFHANSILDASEFVISSILPWSDKSDISMFLIVTETSLTKFFSSSLFFAIENLNKSIFSSLIAIMTERGAWSNDKHKSGWMEWILISVDPLHKNIRSITEFDLVLESEYLVGIWLVENDSSRLKESAIIIRSSLKDEWWGKDESQILSLILKLPVMIKRFEILTSAFLRYFKAVWDESE